MRATLDRKLRVSVGFDFFERMADILDDVGRGHTPVPARFGR
jgi:hypothetical protein